MVLLVAAVILLNVLLFAAVRSQTRGNNASALQQMVNSIRNPYKSIDEELDELSNLVEKFHENEPNPKNDGD